MNKSSITLFIFCFLPVVLFSQSNPSVYSPEIILRVEGVETDIQITFTLDAVGIVWANDEIILTEIQKDYLKIIR